MNFFFQGNLIVINVGTQRSRLTLPGETDILVANRIKLVLRRLS
jgi:hypothetical protein